MTNVDDRDAQIELAFDIFPDLRELQGSRGQHLSGGEQQMLAIARAFIGDNDLLLIDEPNEGLAPSIAADVSESISELRDRRREDCFQWIARGCGRAERRRKRINDLIRQ